MKVAFERGMLYFVTCIISYVIQTLCFSKILSRIDLAAGSTASDSVLNAGAKPDFHVQMTMIYFLSWLLLLPFSNLIWSHNLKLENSLDMTSTVAVLETVLEDDESGEEGEAEGEGEGEEHPTTEQQTTEYRSQQQPLLRKIASRVGYLVRILLTSCLILTVILTYNMSLSLIPPFDVSLIQNVSIFEVVTLSYAISNIARNENVLRNFVVQLFILLNCVLLAYTNATSDFLSGKLSINNITKEVRDPFLFDRLKGGLLTGLGALAIGPFAVICNTVLNKETLINKNSNNRKNLVLISVTSFLILLTLAHSPRKHLEAIQSIHQSSTSRLQFWSYLVAGIVLGTLPNIVSIIKLNAEYPVEVITTCNLAAISLMGFVKWVGDIGQMVVVGWNVVANVVLLVGTVFLYHTLSNTDKEKNAPSI